MQRPRAGRGSALGVGMALALAASVVTSAPANAYHVDPSYHRDRTGLAVVHPDGRVSISPKGEEARPALSLAKLYLGYWVLYNGTDEEKELVEEMVSTSSDAIAGRLDRKYPEAIDEIAEDFDLTQTVRGKSWGNSQTSARDVATFIAAILWDPVAKPLFEGMEDQAEVAADGFIQGFGTARLKDVKGSKMGWSDDRSGATASVSWGEIGDETFAVAALTLGTAYQNTVDTRIGIKQVEDAPKKEKK
ncbi:hypothetical protein JZY91_11330 [Corynebacterium sp. CNCTC7651]|uniref:hypothetical protein n=1 Tax=Corynebacterium sp. CNCTC7651 TaxID=2815361 RepID=UPI001F1A0E47|nr:hypothetical protein [Corynebacterium sp. CNCTC7651]UIZ92212.1 hypothetical protein JZY91_11330 [Corynebacterium sp. CNCTC7651]